MIDTGSDFSGVGAFKIKGFNNYYVDMCGNIYNRNRKLKPQPRSGYLKISLSNLGVVNQMYIHRIVAKAFISNPKNMPEVNHKNGIKNDNRVENLEWVNRKDNAIHSYKNNLQVSQKGSMHGKSKLTEEDVLNIRIRYKKGETLTELSKFFKVAISTLSQIINKKLWKHI